MTTPEEKLAAEMYPATEFGTKRQQEAFVHGFHLGYVDGHDLGYCNGFRLGKAEGDAEGYARAIEAAEQAVRKNAGMPSWEIIKAIRALSPTSPAPGAGERAEVPEPILKALRELDASEEAHLRDCWLHEDDDVSRIDARYHAMKEAQKNLESAIRNWTVRHAIAFAAEKERRSLAAAPDKEG